MVLGRKGGSIRNERRGYKKKERGEDEHDEQQHCFVHITHLSLRLLLISPILILADISFSKASSKLLLADSAHSLSVCVPVGS